MDEIEEDEMSVGLFDSTDLDEMKRDRDIPGLFQRYVRNLQKSGAGFIGRCPNHNDTNPSWSLFRDSDGTWLCKCHKCNDGAKNIFQFIQSETSCPFEKALEIVRDYVGHEDGREEEPEYKSAPERPPYTYNRAATTARLGEAGEYLRSHGVSMDVARAAGVGVDDFPGVGRCITFDYDGTNVKLRALHKKAFRHYPGTSTNSLFYNFGVIEREKPPEIFITESERDCLTMVSHGFPAISVSSATACLSRSDGSFLDDPGVTLTFSSGDLHKLSQVKNIYLALDQDAEGQKCAHALQKALPHAKILTWQYGGKGSSDPKDVGEIYLNDSEGFKNKIVQLCQEATGAEESGAGGGDIGTDVSGDLKKNVTGNVFIGDNHPTTKPITPQFPEDALYGLAGDIVRKLRPQTEAHPAALMAGILTRFGNIVGRTAFFQVEDTQHHCNLFVANVGLSSKSRKGTASARIAKVFESVDPAWHGNRNFSGLSSAEGVIWNVRDSRVGDEGETVDAGVSDKRMLVYEGEFASALQVMKREGNTLSAIIRNAWDGRTLQSLVKNNPAKATGAHISILSDITLDELQLTLAMADKLNGFANRFLWLHCERCGLKPFGGDDIDWEDEIVRLQSAVDVTTERKRVFMDRNARLMWQRAYEDLSESLPGAVGAVTSRGEAQVIRLALIYAMLDESQHIRVEHLHAALAFWGYAVESARFIFECLSPDQNQILSFLDVPRTKTEIYKICFQSHRKADLINADLQTLMRLRRVDHLVEGDRETYLRRK
jgi:hypothetical protein